MEGKDLAKCPVRNPDEICAQPTWVTETGNQAPEDYCILAMILLVCWDLQLHALQLFTTGVGCDGCTAIARYSDHLSLIHI